MPMSGRENTRLVNMPMIAINYLRPITDWLVFTSVRHTIGQPTIMEDKWEGSNYRSWCSRLQPGTSPGSRQCGFQKPRHVEPMLELPTKFQVLASVTWKLNVSCSDILRWCQSPLPARLTLVLTINPE